MDTEYTIVVPDTDVLSKVCGTNDNNLKLIEKHLGVPVFTRGNEISIEDSDPDKNRQFRFIIDRIIDELEICPETSDDMISAILNTGSHHEIERSSIIIPGAVMRIYSRSINQANYIKLLREKEMIICTGPAGSGKTFLAVAEALRLVLSRKKSRIVLTRPIVEAGESLGFLPGDLEQKINPYLRPLYDSMNTVLSRESVRKLFEMGAIEIAPLAYMRGRTLNNSVIILDEAQNTTLSQMKMFLTRMGENSRVFISGDVTQIDLPKKQSSGLVNALQILSDIPEIGIMKMESGDVVRNKLVQKIVQAYDRAENKKG